VEGVQRSGRRWSIFNENARPTLSQGLKNDKSKESNVQGMNRKTGGLGGKEAGGEYLGNCCLVTLAAASRRIRLHKMLAVLFAAGFRSLHILGTFLKAGKTRARQERE